MILNSTDLEVWYITEMFASTIIASSKSLTFVLESFIVPINIESEHRIIKWINVRQVCRTSLRE